MILHQFFSALQSGDQRRLFGLLHSEAVFVAGQAVPTPPLDRICGTYRGEEQISLFFQRLVCVFTLQDFQVEHCLEQGDVAFASGHLTYGINGTERVFSSEWCVRCLIENGKIKHYRFFEDTDALSKVLAEK